MSSTTLDAYCQPDLVNEREVAAFLCHYPDFFERHPEILTELSIPHPDSGQAVSLLERQLTALRAQLSAERQDRTRLMARAEQNERLQNRLRNLFLVLSEVACLGELLSQVPTILVEEFSLACSSLRVLKTQAPDLDFAEIVPSNDVMAVILGRLETKGGFCDDRLPREAKDFLFGKQARMVESVAIVGILNQGGVLALGAREVDRYCPGMDTVFLEFAGSLVSATWRRVMSSSEGAK
jgi:hypothetical protein